MAAPYKPKPSVAESPPPVGGRSGARSKRLRIYLSADEYAMIRLQARRHGRTMGSYVRAMCLDESFRRAHVRYVGLLASKLAGTDRVFTRPGEVIDG